MLQLGNTNKMNVYINHTILSFPKVSKDHLLIDRIALVAPIPLLAIRIFSIAWSPPLNATKSCTLLKNPASDNGGVTFLVFDIAVLFIWKMNLFL